MIKDGQVKELRRMLNLGKTLAASSRMTEMTEKTARNYRDDQRLPSQRESQKVAGESQKVAGTDSSEIPDTFVCCQSQRDDMCLCFGVHVVLSGLTVILHTGPRTRALAEILICH